MRLKQMLFAAVLASAGSAPAQTSVGELLDGGAKKLSGDEVRTLVPGATLVGRSFAGSDVSVDYKQDGTLSGRVQINSGPRAGQIAGIVGTWTIADDGKTCAVVTVPSGGRDQICAYYFKLGDRYFIAESDSDKGSAVVQRTIKRP